MLIRTKPQELLVPGAGDGGLTAECGGKYRVILRMRRDAAYPRGELSHSGVGIQESQDCCCVLAGEAGGEVGVGKRPR
jgi:hypothetical protein